MWGHALMFIKKNGIRLIWIVIFFSSVAGNAVLFVTTTKLFTKLQFNRIFPLGYIPGSSTRKFPETPPRSQTLKLLFLGDSRTQMWDLSSLKEKYAVLNLGYGGQTSSQVVLQTLSENIPECDWMILQVGINDIHSIGAFSDLKPLIIKNLKRNISKIVDDFTSRKAKIILTTLFPAWEPPLSRKLFWDEDGVNIIEEINAYIENLADDTNIFCVDAYALLLGTDQKIKKEYLDPDFFLHVNDTAYTLLNTEIEQIIEANSNSPEDL